MKGRDIIKMILLERGVSADDFFGDCRTVQVVEARKEAILAMLASGFNQRKTAKIMRRHYDTVRYWGHPKYRENNNARSIAYFHAHKPVPRKMPSIDTKPILASAMAAHSVNPNEFFGRETSSRITSARRRAMIALQAAGFNNREIATITKRHIHTVRYWLNPENRVRRIKYKQISRRVQSATEQAAAGLRSPDSGAAA